MAADNDSLKKLRQPTAGRLLLAMLLLLPVGCGASASATTGLTGEIKIDGSSTVLLISEAMATSFMRLHPGVDVTVGSSGTGGGLKKFAAGEIDIADASRQIKPREVEACHANGVDFIELAVGLDGISVVIHKDNTWARQLTVAQLHKIWAPSTATFRDAHKWSDVDPSWPKAEIVLYGPGSNSGTFDYFTEEINGQEDVCRTDYGASEDDNSIINGVRDNRYALGFLGYAYYAAHADTLNAAAIAPQAGAAFRLPTEETILTGQYRPLSRPLFIYVRTTALQRPEVQAFVHFYLRRADLVSKAGYVPMPVRRQWEQRQHLEQTLYQK